jgi:hypothetical protein
MWFNVTSNNISVISWRSVGETGIPHSWEGGRADCYPEQFIVNRGEAEVDNEISRGNNLFYHPLSYVLFVLLYWMFFSPGLAMCYLYSVIIIVIFRVTSVENIFNLIRI